MRGVVLIKNLKSNTIRHSNKSYSIYNTQQQWRKYHFLLYFLPTSPSFQQMEMHRAIAWRMAPFHGEVLELQYMHHYANQAMGDLVVSLNLINTNTLSFYSPLNFKLGVCNCVVSLNSCNQLLAGCPASRTAKFTTTLPSVIYVGQYYEFK